MVTHEVVEELLKVDYERRGHTYALTMMVHLLLATVTKLDPSFDLTGVLTEIRDGLSHTEDSPSVKAMFEKLDEIESVWQENRILVEREGQELRREFGS